MRWTVTDDVRRWMKPRGLLFTGVAVAAEHPETWAEIERLGQELRNAHRRQDLLRVPGVSSVRLLYRGLGIDPTKHRPSSEALLRRVLGGKPLYRVNAAVDAGNLISLRHQVPIGMYDLGAIASPVTLRRGRDGEHYKGIGKDRVNVEGRPTLVDRIGPFGNPTSDSARTRVTLETTALALISFEPADRDDAVLAEHADAAERILTRAVGGRCAMIEFATQS